MPLRPYVMRLCPAKIAQISIARMSEFIECARKTELGHAGALKLAFQSISINIGWAIQKSWAMNLYAAGYGVNEDQPNRHAKFVKSM